MKLRPETIAANRARHAREYPNYTLAPDPYQPQLDLRPARYADLCPRCRCTHMSAADAEHCRQANMQREQD